MKKLMSSFKTRSFRVGGYSVIATLILVALIVLINVVVNILPATYTEFDTTANGLYSLSDETKDIVSRVSDKVNLYWVVTDGKEDPTVENMLDRYLALNKNLKLQKVDPSAYPTFAATYGQDSLEDNSVIVESSLRYRYVPNSDIYLTNYDYDASTGNYSSSQSFDGEHALTSALNFVSTDVLPKVYALTGHGEADLSENYKKQLEKQNMTVESLSFVTSESIPSDCDILLINNPLSDITEGEKELLTSYLAEGGKLMLVTGFMQPDQSRDNLQAVMALYGITETPGVVLETESGYTAAQAPYYLLPKIGSHSITKPLRDNNYMVMCPVASGLTVASQLSDGETAVQLLTTSNTAYSKVDFANSKTYEKSSEDVDGPFALGVLVEQKDTRIVWFSSAYITSDEISELVAGANEDLFTNAMSYIAGDESNITIHSKSLTNTYLSITAAQTTILSVILVGVLPLLCLAAGIFIFVRRRVK